MALNTKSLKKNCMRDLFAQTIDYHVILGDCGGWSLVNMRNVVK